MKIFLFVLLPILFLSGCSVTPYSSAINDQCESSNTVTVRQSAEDQYSKMVRCVKSGNDALAADYFALAGVTTWYDAIQRPGELSNARHKNLLKKSLSILKDNEKKRFWEHLTTTLHSERGLNNVCDFVVKNGPKDNHEREVWNNAMTSYLHCRVTVQ